MIKILETIESMYPQTKFSDEMVLMWIKKAKKMDYQLVMQKLSIHIETQAFPPKLAQIAVFQREENVFLQQMKQWEQEGRERIERDLQLSRRKPTPSWLSESIPG